MKERQDTLQIAQEYSKAHRRKTLWYRAVTCLAAVVVFCTTYALILPAITLEKKCEIPEHTHTDACYTQVTTREKRNPICAVKADVVVHRHDSACYNADGSLCCTLPEVQTHQHTDACYTVPEAHSHTDACYTQERGECICTESTEPAHRHSDACYGETSVLICGEDHEHGESCYEIQRELICSLTEEPAHTHSDSCYQWNKVLTCSKSTTPGAPELACGKQEVILHTHEPYVSEENPGCYDTDGKTLVCGKPQIVEHQHTDACFETVEEPVDTETLTCTLPEDENHTHTARCYGTWERICGMEEHTHSEECTAPEETTYCGKEAHIHGEACYDENGELICTLEEHTHSEECTAPEETTYCGKEAHTHGEGCRDENGELVCTLEEHTHSLACYSDPTADVETAEIWEQTFAGVTLTGNWRQDAVSIAQTQLGYTESTKNYMVAEDGETVKGYTRYGAWYGDPYADWDTMFLSFCLHYAGVEDIPLDSDCGSWVTAWADAFVPAQSYNTAAGDLVFFDRDGDGTADHAGLVTEVTDSGFTAIEGDAEDAVQLLTYAAEDPTILGYVNLPEGAKEFTLTAQTETGITVTITGDSTSLPYPAKEITVTAAEVVDEERQTIRDQLLGEEKTESEKSFLLDITLWHGEEKIEPTGPVTVTFGGFDTEGLYPKVYHIDTEAQTATDMEAEKGENGDVSVATDHFSLYDIQLLSITPISGYIGNALANGGEFQLTSDAWTEDNNSYADLTISKDTTIDLNGHTLYISKSTQYFNVTGGTLTIKDSSAVSDTVSYPGGTLYKNVASLNGSTLTYYITTSAANGTGTTETLENHTVTLSGMGRLQCSEASPQAVLVFGGTLKIQSGMLRNSNGGRVVCVDSGTLAMEGGYIVDGSGDHGGGVYTNGTVNMSGGVIAANHANAGGGIYVSSGTVNISGGAVAGNWVNDGHNSGGGIYVASGTLNLSGSGYVTNNSKSCECDTCKGDVNNEHGGGGITLAGSSKMNMTGGYVTGNYSGLAGGGIYAGFYGGSANFTMSGGTIASNCAELGEGGGLRIAGGTNGVIQTMEKVYITNNKTLTPDDWGGGGIFVQENGILTIMDALITNNSADGFGGGVGACPTGKTLIVNKDGAAIYGNTSKGENMSDGGNGKDYDRTVAQASPVFKQNGYTDYFCVRSKENANDPISLVTGQMAGGGAANWKGSCDEQPVSIGPSGYAAAKYLFGLVAYPDDTAKSKAVSAAKVIITGNHSNIHGGGIMTNGGLILGKKDTVITATPALDITGTKALLKDGVSQSDGLDFEFQLKDSSGKVVGTATANASTGKFTISPNTKYSEAGTYTYTLSEVNDRRTGVTYDASEYTIQVTIAKKDVTLLGVTFTSYYVNSVNISKSGGADTTEPTQPDPQPDTHPNTFRVHFKNSNNWGTVSMHIWSANGLHGETSWPGITVAADLGHPGWHTEEFTVSGNGNFSYIFSNNGSNKTGDLSGNYSPGGDLWVYADGSSTTTAPDDWNGGSSGSNVSFTGTKNSDESYSLTINGNAFTNRSTTPMNLQILKTDSNNASKKLKDAKFCLTKKGETNGTEVITGANGIATFENIQRNATYYLRETEPPANYMTAGPWILEVAESTATLYPAAEGDNGTLTKTSATGTPLSVSGSDSKVLKATISDQPWGYELPNTGGAGTQLYTMGGCALIAVYLLLYSHRRRRKEDAVSS